MIKKLRLKIIALTMALLTVVLGAVCLGVYGAAQRAVAVDSTEALHNALLGEESGRPVLVLDVLPSGTVRMIGASPYSEETLLAIVNDCLAQEADNGILQDYDVRYVRHSGLALRIALADCAWEKATLHAVLTTLLLVGAGALLVLFVCAYVLSGLITRPVAKAWRGQQQFISDAGHELKTPLTVILSSAELLRDTVSDDNGYIDNICAEGGRMKKLVESLLTLSRLENLPPRSMGPVDLSLMAEKLTMSFEPVAFESGHPLQSDIAPRIVAKGNEEQLHRAVAVLLDNALKYGAPGTPVVLTLKGEGKMAALSVENFGAPLSAEAQEHLFDRFYRADTSRHSEGFGLGLPIARQIANAHRGSIACKSDEHSTRFTLHIPKQ